MVNKECILKVTRENFQNGDDHHNISMRCDKDANGAIVASKVRLQIRPTKLYNNEPIIVRANLDEKAQKNLCIKIPEANFSSGHTTCVEVEISLLPEVADRICQSRNKGNLSPLSHRFGHVEFQVGLEGNTTTICVGCPEITKLCFAQVITCDCVWREGRGGGGGRLKT